MAIPQWPSSLPEYVLRDDYQGTLPDLTIESEMDQGPTKKRQRFTAGEEPIQVGWRMTESQLDTFRDFYLNDIGAGALSFEITHPRNRNTIEVRFQGQPTWRSVGHEEYDVSATLEIMP